MTTKYFCDVCDKETDGILLEQFQNDVNFYSVFPEFDDEGTETRASVRVTLQDLCKDCHALLYDFLAEMKKVKTQL